MVQAADTAPGKTLFEATCVACHGAQGQGNPAVSAPALAGQQAVYLQRQLLNFRSGLRGAADGDSGAASMVPMAKSLPDDAAVTAVADYLASLPAEEAEKLRAEARAKKSAETKAGRARATPEQKEASRERYRQAALRRHAAKKASAAFGKPRVNTPR